MAKNQAWYKVALTTLVQKLSSRKFLLTVFALVVLLGDIVPPENTYEFVGLIVGYLVAEGYADGKRSTEW